MYKNSMFVFFNKSGELFCSCGHRENFGLDETVLFHNDKWDIICPKCQNKEHYKIYTNKYNRIFHHVQNYVNGEKVSLAAKVGCYFYNKLKEKITYIDQSFRLTFNADSGYLYFIHGNKIINITFQGISKKYYDLLIKLRNHNPEKIKEFIDLCFKKRGLCYKTINDFIDQYGNLDFWNAILFLRFPQLENTPIQNYGYIPKSVRHELKRLTTKQEIFRLFFGTNAKSTLKLLREESDYLTAHILSRVIKKVDNLNKLLSLKVRFERHNFWSQEKEIIYIPVRIDNYFYEGIFHRQHDIDEIIQTLQFLLEKYKEETILVNRICKEVEQTRNPYIYDTLKDIYRLHQHIIEVNPDYEFNWKKYSFSTIHDYLSKDLERYRNKNIPINYTEREKSYEGKYGKYQVKLAPDTDSLIDVGTKMRICVGSYGSLAVSKQTTIVIFYKDDIPKICIEIDPNGNIVQAKLEYNQKPIKEIPIIKEWAKQNNLKWDNCYDLKQVA